MQPASFPSVVSVTATAFADANAISSPAGVMEALYAWPVEPWAELSAYFRGIAKLTSGPLGSPAWTLSQGSSREKT